jgi:4-amino-4-deoxy-L-arabinose transferase-like glycosyltransferase
MPQWLRSNAKSLALLAALLVWVLVVRAPYLHGGPINHDDAFYWMYGNAWRLGDPPYGKFWDLKPPGTFALYAVVSGLFGADPAGIRIVALGFVFAAAVGLYQIGARHLNSRTVGLTAAAILVPYTLDWYGLVCEPDIFMVPLVIWAFKLALDVGESAAMRPNVRLFCAGLLLGAAFSLKQTAGIEGAFVFFYLIWRTRRVARVAAYAAGTALIPLAFAAYFAEVGLFKEMWDASIVSAIRRTGGDQPLSIAPARFVILLLPAAPLALAAVIAGLERRSLLAHLSPRPTGALIFILAWLAMESLSVLAMHASLQYYFLPLLAPLTLLTAVVIGLFLQRGGAQRIGGIIGLVLVIGFPFGYFAQSEEAVLSRNFTPRQIGQFILAQNGGKPGTLYVVDYEPVVYQASGFQPVTRHPLPMQLICPFTAVDLDPEREIAKAVARRPDFMVVTKDRHRLLCEIRARAQLAVTWAETTMR